MPDGEVSLARVSNAEVLLQAMIEKNADPAAVRAWIDNIRIWRQQEAVEAFNAAMTACQQEMPVVVKDATNKDNGSKYAKLETIAFTARPIYTKHGFSISYGEEPAMKEGCIGLFIKVRHSQGHVEQYHGDYQLDNVGMKGSPNKTAIQGTVSSHSYAKRDLLCMAFNITIAGTDLDGQAPTDRVITPAEHTEIANAAIASEKAGEIRNKDHFFDWLCEQSKVASLKDIRKSTFDKGMAELKRKAKPTS